LSTLRTASVWLVAILLVAVATAFFLALTATQLTGDESGEVVLRRSVAVITDIDATLPRIEADLTVAADEADGDTVRVPWYPLAVDLTVDEARTLRGQDLRDRILDESADILYADGQSAWTGTDDEAVQDIDRLSAAGFVERGLGLVQESVHTAFVIIAVLLGIMTFAMVGILLIALPATPGFSFSLVTLARPPVSPPPWGCVSRSGHWRRHGWFVNMCNRFCSMWIPIPISLPWRNGAALSSSAQLHLVGG
jgi:hypothetical protein